MRAVENIQSVLGAGEHTIGAFVFWSLESVHFKREAIRASFEYLNLEHAIPRDPTDTATLAKAVAEVMKGQDRYFARRLPGKAWGLVREIKEGSRLVHSHDATLQITDGAVCSVIHIEDNAAVNEVRTAIIDVEREYADLREYMRTADLSTVLSTLMNGTTTRSFIPAVSLRDKTGGLYFVHRMGVEDMRGVAEAIHALAPKCKVSIFDLRGDADNLEQAAEAARRSFRQQLRELQTELAAFKDGLKADGKEATARNLAVRADRFGVLQDRVQYFRDVLGSVGEHLGREIEASKKALLDELALVTESA